MHFNVSHPLTVSSNVNSQLAYYSRAFCVPFSEVYVVKDYISLLGTLVNDMFSGSIIPCDVDVMAKYSSHGNRHNSDHWYKEEGKMLISIVVTFDHSTLITTLSHDLSPTGIICAHMT